MELNRILLSFRTEMHTVRAWRILDHYFNVSCGINRREMELTRTCCFEFDRKRGPGSKVLFLRHIRFYFRVARFIHRSLLPEVDKILEATYEYRKQGRFLPFTEDTF